MDSFAIAIDLSDFFTDSRAKSLIFVNRDITKSVSQVCDHIRNLFEINKEISLFSSNNFLPGKEDSLILKHLDSLSVKAASFPVGACNDYFESDLHGNVQENTLSSNDVRKRKSKDNSNHNESSEIPKYMKKKSKIKRVDVEDACTDDGLSTLLDCLSKKKRCLQKLIKDNIQSKRVCSYDVTCQNDTENDYQEDMMIHDSEHIEETHEEMNKTEEGDMLCGNGIEQKLNLSLDEGGTKSKRKRVRKRKKAMTQESDTTVSVTSVPQYISPAPFVKSMQFGKTKHIYFPDEDGDPETAEGEIQKESAGKAVKPAVSETTVNRPIKASVGTDLGNFWSTFKQKASEHEAESEKIENPSIEETSLQTIQKKEVQKKIDQEAFPAPLNSPQTVISRTQSEPSPQNKISGGKIKPSVSETNVSRPTEALLQAKLASSSKNFLSVCEQGAKENEAPSEKIENPTIEKTPPNTTTNIVSGTESSPSLHNKNVSPSTQILYNPQPEPSWGKIPAVPTSSTSNDTKNISGTSKTDFEVPLRTIPAEESKISFKILKMSSSYTPEISGTIVAVVEKIEGETLVLRLISGAEECVTPKGKFDLDQEEEEEYIVPEVVNYNWRELIDPTLCQ